VAVILQRSGSSKSLKQRLRRRVLEFSAAASVISLVLFAGILTTVLFLPSYQKLGEINYETARRIHCIDGSCDLEDLVNDTNFISADYILTRKDHYFIDQRRHPGFPIEFSNRSVLGGFRKPADWIAPTNEKWRIFSEVVEIAGRKVEVAVGIVVEASYLREPSTSREQVDKQLIEEAGKIRSRLRFNGTELVSLGVTTKADGYEVVNDADQAVIDWGGGIPAYLPSNRAIPAGLLFIDPNTDLNLVRVDYVGNLILISLQKVGSLWLLLGTAAFVFFLAFVSFQSVGRTVLKTRLMLIGQKPPTVGEALQSGEGQKIEFKRGIVDEDLLKSVAAFANTNDGTIFIGVDDAGKITGIKLDTPGEKSSFAHKIYTVVRQRVKPIPPIEMYFEDIRGYVVARVIVARGDERLYFLDGIIYVRHGDSDVKGEPSVVSRILQEYA
jgi:hypothetical protein